MKTESKYMSEFFSLLGAIMDPILLAVMLALAPITIMVFLFILEHDDRKYRKYYTYS